MMSGFEAKAFTFSTLIVALCGVPLLWFYNQNSEKVNIIDLGLVFLLNAVISAIASVYSGLNLAAGKSALTLFFSSFRALPALVLISLAPNTEPLSLALAFTAGEVLRLTSLRLLIGRVFKSRKLESITYSTMAKHTLSSATAQLSPMVDRSFLGLSDLTALTYYELSDRAYWGVMQLLNFGLVIPKMSKWAKALQLNLRAEVLKKDFKNMIAISILFVCFGVLGATAFVYVLTDVDSWRGSILWISISLAGLPFGLVNAIGAKVFVILGKHELLLRLAVPTVVVNAFLDWILFGLLGPIGIILGSFLTRLFTAMLYLSVWVWIIGTKEPKTKE
jgi:peptidoglycan biosynthesis protein MviN/MurJ (putative lipid II flippase)